MQAFWGIFCTKSWGVCNICFFKSSALTQKPILNLDLMVYLEEIEPEEE